LTAFKKTRVPGCCGSFSTTYELSFPLRKEYVPHFESAGFFISKPFLQAGMFYAENKDFIAIGTFGGKNLQLKCKVRQCDTLSTPLDNVLIHLYGFK
jgi:hypothetical protein